MVNMMVRMRAIDVFDAFNLNGYIDLAQACCIVPKWYVDSLKEIDDYDFVVRQYGRENADYTEEDYRRIEEDAGRYLCPPVFHPLGSNMDALLKMGYTWDDISDWGIDRDEAAGIFIPGSEFRRTSTPPHASDREWDILKKINGKMLEEGRYMEYSLTHHQIMNAEIKVWCMEHGIEMFDA